MPFEQLYTSPAIYEHIWSPILNTFDGVQTIYFSPSGLLHNIGVEYAVDDSGLEMNETIDFHRLSSTRQLLEERKAGELNDFVLLGGINYNLKGTSREVVPQGGLAYLPATAAEVEGVFSHLRKNNKNVECLEGDEASERNLHKITADGHHDVFHFATHGFYFSNGKEDSASFRDMDANVFHTVFSDTESIENSCEDFSLTQSGLFLAGANERLAGAKLESDDDGILYSSEITALPLKDTSVVVLSACGTALGDLSCSEGVFGVQRGFKLAGAEKLVMSLWKVDDEATKVFMEKLYAGLMESEDVETAFRDARMELRLSDAGKWDSPEYYNAFVLLK